MLTRITIDVTHRKEIPHLADMIAGRAYTLDGVTDANVISDQPQARTELERAGFTTAEIALGNAEVHRT